MNFIQAHQASGIFLDLLHKNALGPCEVMNIGLCGGRSISSFYDDIHDSLELFLPFECVNFFLTDEKYESHVYCGENTATIREFLFQKSYCAILNEKIFFGSFLGKMKEDLDSFNLQLQKLNISSMDILILGVGEDGHVAGIFPHPDEVGREEVGYVMVNNSQKPPHQRITMSPGMIRSAKTVFLFFVGEGKRAAYKNFLDFSKNEVDCPAKIAMGVKNLYVVTDFNE